MIRFAHFSDHYKMASPIKLLQNEGARPPIEALFSEARTHLSLHLDARVIFCGYSQAHHFVVVAAF